MYPDILRKYNIRLNKDLGQHFLTDNSSLKKIVDAADITKDDLVLEIGTGIGTLTKPLAEKAGFVITVEMDKRLIHPAEEYLKDFRNIHLINEDIMKVNIPREIAKHKGFRHLKVVANLPYYITSPILSLLLEGKAKFEVIVVTIQKEVAERIVSEPGIKEYGSFSIFVNFYAKPRIVSFVPRTAFIPSPEVGSAVLRLDVLKKPPVEVKDEKLFFRVMHAAFRQRRKMLRNAMVNANLEGVGKDEIDKALAKSGIDGKRRGETLSIGEFAALANCLARN